VCFLPIYLNSMNGENRLLVSDKPIEFEINRLKFKT
jgi:hypothetical protein